MDQVPLPTAAPSRRDGSLFLAIAPEVRIKIYQEIFRGERVVVQDRRNSWSETPIAWLFYTRFPEYANVFLACHLTYSEALPVFYEQVQLIWKCGDPPSEKQQEIPTMHKFHNITIKCRESDYGDTVYRWLFPIMDFDVAVLSQFERVKRLEFLLPTLYQHNHARTIDFSLVDKSSPEELSVIMEKVLENPCFRNCLPKMKSVHDYFKARTISSTVDRHAQPSLSVKIEQPDGPIKRSEIFPRLELLEDGLFALSYDFAGYSYRLKGKFENGKQGQGGPLSQRNMTRIVKRDRMSD